MIDCGKMPTVGYGRCICAAPLVWDAEWGEGSLCVRSGRRIWDCADMIYVDEESFAEAREMQRRYSLRDALAEVRRARSSYANARRTVKWEPHP